MGYASPNVFTMYIRGEAALPVARAIDLAEILDIDLREMIDVAVENYRTHPTWYGIGLIVSRLQPPEAMAAV